MHSFSNSTYLQINLQMDLVKGDIFFKEKRSEK